MSHSAPACPAASARHACPQCPVCCWICELVGLLLAPNTQISELTACRGACQWAKRGARPGSWRRPCPDCAWGCRAASACRACATPLTLERPGSRLSGRHHKLRFGLAGAPGSRPRAGTPRLKAAAVSRVRSGLCAAPPGRSAHTPPRMSAPMAPCRSRSQLGTDIYTLTRPPAQHRHNVRRPKKKTVRRPSYLCAQRLAQDWRPVSTHSALPLAHPSSKN